MPAPVGRRFVGASKLLYTTDPLPKFQGKKLSCSSTYFPRASANLHYVSYEVSTPVYEGPFDLLLHLITSEEVDLYEISISKIVDRFLGELERIASGLDLASATEFALIAATLIQLKCRKLLPASDEVELDEELAMWEERDLLLSKLLEFSAFKEVAAMMRERIELASKSLPRVAGLDERYFDLTPDLLQGVTPEKVRKAMLRVITPKPVPQLELDHVTIVNISVAQTIKDIAYKLREVRSATFRELTSETTQVLEVVVAFLAILELYKQDLVEIEQAERFGDIVVEWRQDSAWGEYIDIDSIEVSAELSQEAVDRALASVSEEYEG